MNKEMMGICGAYCGVCDWRESTNCLGCQKSSSKMFWGDCLVAKCALEKGLKHCGLCSDSPCEKLQNVFDDPEHGDNGERLHNIKGWAKGEESYLKLTTIKPDDNKHR